MYFFDIATPYRVTFTSEQEAEASAYINRYNGVKPLFRTIYNYTAMNGSKRPNYQKPVLDCFVYDFDTGGKADPFEETKRLLSYLKEHGVTYKISQTSKSRYHATVFCKPITDAYNAQAVLRNAQLYFINKLKLQCDPHLVGDVARVVRIPGTYHTKKRCFCITLTDEEFLQGPESTAKLAAEQRSIQHIMPGKLVSLELLPQQKDFSFLRGLLGTIEHKGFEESEIDHHALYEQLPRCAKRSLRSDPRWQERSWLILTLKDVCGFLEEETTVLLKHYLPEVRFKHCVFEERQVYHIYRGDYPRPRFDSLVTSGFCESDCDCRTRGAYYGDR